MPTAGELKRAAAAAALDLVRPGMRLGLGTGSTAAEFVTLLGARVAAGLRIEAVPTSEATANLAGRLGIPLIELDGGAPLDLTIDGADEIGPTLALIKGAGGALLREKIVAAASREFVIIADVSKRVGELGACPLPIEIVPFGAKATRAAVAAAARALGLAGDLVVRTSRDGATFLTDAGNLVVDAHFGSIPDPPALALALDRIPGVVEHGLFLGMASAAFVAGPAGVEHLLPD